MNGSRALGRCLFAGEVREDERDGRTVDGAAGDEDAEELRLRRPLPQGVSTVGEAAARGEDVIQEDERPPGQALSKLVPDAERVIQDMSA